MWFDAIKYNSDYTQENSGPFYGFFAGNPKFIDAAQSFDTGAKL